MSMNRPAKKRAGQNNHMTSNRNDQDNSRPAHRNSNNSERNYNSRSRVSGSNNSAFANSSHVNSAIAAVNALEERNNIEGEMAPVEGLYENHRAVNALSLQSGMVVSLMTKNMEHIEGIFDTFSKDGVIVLKMARTIPHSKKDTIFHKPLTDEEHLELDTKFENCMVLQFNHVLTMFCSAIDTEYNSGDVGPPVQQAAGFATDRQISGANGVSRERQLQAWTPDEDDVPPSNFELLESAPSGNGKSQIFWGPEEMFDINNKKFGVSTTYTPEMQGYTTPLVVDRNSDRYKKAERAALEIEKNPRRIDDDEREEEDRYSAVVRHHHDNSMNGGASGGYLPPHKRHNKAMAGPPPSRSNINQPPRFSRQQAERERQAANRKENKEGRGHVQMSESNQQQAHKTEIVRSTSQDVRTHQADVRAHHQPPTENRSNHQSPNETRTHHQPPTETRTHHQPPSETRTQPDNRTQPSADIRSHQSHGDVRTHQPPHPDRSHAPPVVSSGVHSYPRSHDQQPPASRHMQQHGGQHGGHMYNNYRPDIAADHHSRSIQQLDRRISHTESEHKYEGKSTSNNSNNNAKAMEKPPSKMSGPHHTVSNEQSMAEKRSPPPHNSTKEQNNKMPSNKAPSNSANHKHETLVGFKQFSTEFNLSHSSNDSPQSEDRKQGRPSPPATKGSGSPPNIKQERLSPPQTPVTEKKETAKKGLNPDAPEFVFSPLATEFKPKPTSEAPPPAPHPVMQPQQQMIPAHPMMSGAQMPVQHIQGSPVATGVPPGANIPSGAAPPVGFAPIYMPNGRNLKARGPLVGGAAPQHSPMGNHLASHQVIVSAAHHPSLAHHPPHVMNNQQPQTYSYIANSNMVRLPTMQMYNNPDGTTSGNHHSGAHPLYMQMQHVQQQPPPPPHTPQGNQGQPQQNGTAVSSQQSNHSQATTVPTPAATPVSGIMYPSYHIQQQPPPHHHHLQHQGMQQQAPHSYQTLVLQSSIMPQPAQAPPPQGGGVGNPGGAQPGPPSHGHSHLGAMMPHHQQFIGAHQSPVVHLGVGGYSAVRFPGHPGVSVVQHQHPPTQ